ncbi:MAG: hypothetical protein M1819_001045 [Sarea resinae]|nr:MAG: hypothetical protein M1819_001045 [Sarea resinae]
MSLPITPPAPQLPPRAILFDVFGTVVDWRTTVTRTLTETCAHSLSNPASSLASATRVRASDLTIEDWGRFAQQWRNTYKHFTKTTDPKTTFISVDEHHHLALQQLLREWKLDGLYNPEELAKLSRVWHFLDPWPDSSRGIAELNKQGYTTATLSNGNISLLSDLAAHAELPFTHIFSSEHFRAYKPHPEVYKGAAERLGLKPEECVLVAAHLGDLKAARCCGFRTVYVERYQEEDWTPDEVERAKAWGWVDIWVGMDDPGLLEVVREIGKLTRD